MNILAHVRLYPPRDGAGAEWYLHECLLALKASGDTVHVTGPGEWIFEGVTVSDDYPPPSVVVSQIDHSQRARALAARLGVPFVHISHHARQYGHKPTLQVANSQHVAEAGHRYGPVQVCRPHTPASRYGGRQTRRRLIVLLNRSRAKGAPVFYQLAAAHPEHSFVAVTGAWDQQLLAPELANLTVLPNQPDVATILRQARVLYQGSADESWGRAALEAAHRGIPSLVCPCPGVYESIGAAGLYHTYGDAECASELLTCLTDPAMYAEHSMLAQDRALEVEHVTRDDLARFCEAVHALV